MTADFSGGDQTLPPGLTGRFIDQGRPLPQPCWASSLSRRDVLSLGDSNHNLVIGGQTVWSDASDPPASVVVSHPNRLGAPEDLPTLLPLVRRWKAAIYVDTDPFLLGIWSAHADVTALGRWDGDPVALESVGTRCRLAADAFRRRILQVPGIKPVSRIQAGRSVALLTPRAASDVATVLARSQVIVDTFPLWSGLVVVWLGWWHTRRQIDQLVAAIGATLDGDEAPTVDPDDYTRLPDDLPRRRLDTI